MLTLNNGNKFEYSSSGLFKSSGEWIHPKRIIDTYEIIFMCGGTAYIAEDEVQHTLNKNDILLLRPAHEHYGFLPSPEHVSFFWLHYRTDCAAYKSFPPHISLSAPHTLKTLFSQCLHAANTPSASPLCSDLYAALILEEIIRAAKSDNQKSSYLAARIKDHITLNSEQNLSVQAIARHFGYHENYINAVFKAAYGIPLKKYLQSTRISCAKSLLSTTMYTVNQISADLCFKSENHFVKFFKYHTGITPTQYRDSFINTHVNNS